ncbi:hypothetical protein EIP91_002191 [Steccherinum ochraceum]|uniref:Uncharacterized protein n=1 Tax=Steccherinum ochraceum TaxID=92696 RepID=A0A4R0RPR5_9APHY|nr:hypothetical protein EIP91_002191 [Steccherinum ochraceum]
MAGYSPHHQPSHQPHPLPRHPPSLSTNYPHFIMLKTLGEALKMLDLREQAGTAGKEGDEVAAAPGIHWDTFLTTNPSFVRSK